MTKKVLIIVGGIVLVLAILIWQVFANLDSIVASVIEDEGSKALQTEVSVSGVSIDLKTAKAGIAGMTIANPDGYSRANLFEMEGIEIDLDLDSLSKDVLVIESIRIKNPEIIFEENDSGGNNMQALLDNIESGSSGNKDATGVEAAKMIINVFEFSGGHVKASSKLRPGEVMDINLPAIRMTGIGKAQGGVTADVVADEITSELVNAIISAAAKAGVSKMIKKKGFLDRLKGDG